MENTKAYFKMMTEVTAVPNVLIDHYRDLGLTEQETLFIITLLRLKQKKPVITFRIIGRETVYTEGDAKALTPLLIDKGFLSLGSEGEIVLDHIPEMLVSQLDWELIKQEENISVKKNSRDSKDNEEVFNELYHCFENEFGRPLSPMEGEQISYWFKDKQLSSELIREALKRAVLNGKFTFSYIKAILNAWDRAKLKTVSQVEVYEENRSSKRQKERDTERSSGGNNLRGSQTNYDDDLYEN